MKKITKEEFEELEKENIVIKEIFKLEIGEGLEISKEEWIFRTIPTVYLGNYRKRGFKNWKTKTLKDGKGWVVFRIS